MNPNFKPHMITDKLLKACKEQVQKYFGEREMDSECLICLAIPLVDCSICPLGDGVEDLACLDDPTFLGIIQRQLAKKSELLARGNRLIEIMDEHGITIDDAEAKEWQPSLTRL